MSNIYDLPFATVIEYAGVVYSRESDAGEYLNSRGIFLPGTALADKINVLYVPGKTETKLAGELIRELGFGTNFFLDGIRHIRINHGTYIAANLVDGGLLNESCANGSYFEVIEDD